MVKIDPKIINSLPWSESVKLTVYFPVWRNFAGSSIGTSISHFLSGYLSDNFGWEFSFYFFGFVAIVFAMAWNQICFNSPDSHPEIKQVRFFFTTKFFSKKCSHFAVWRASITYRFWYRSAKEVCESRWEGQMESYRR